MIQISHLREFENIVLTEMIAHNTTFDLCKNLSK